MKKKVRYFRKYDILIYSFIISIYVVLGLKIRSFEVGLASKAEVYVNNELKYVYPLVEEERDYFVNTDIGGVDIKIKDYKIRVMTSNSPLKLNVKQGWIEEPGEVIIGIPDKLLVKIIGESNEEIDIIL